MLSVKEGTVRRRKAVRATVLLLKIKLGIEVLKG